MQNTTTSTCDGLGRTISAANSTVTDPEASVYYLPALSAYDARGSVMASWAAGACKNTEGYVWEKASRATYDALGRKGDDHRSRQRRHHLYYSSPRTTRPSRIWLHKQVNPDGTWIEYTYDMLGRVTATLTSTGATTAASYDAGGRCVSATNPNGFTTSSTYDLLGRQLTAGGSGQSASQFVYNTLGWKLGSRTPTGSRAPTCSTSPVG